MRLGVKSGFSPWMGGVICGLFCLGFGLIAVGQEGEKEEHPLAPALKLANESLEALQSVKDYTALFTKQELIGRRTISQTMDIKLREKPFSVYLKFHNPHRGREVIFVDGANKGNFLVHEEGIKSIAGTVSLHPESNDAMAESRYPITKIGMANMLDAVIDQWEDESKYGEVNVKFYMSAKLGETACIAVESSHPQPRRQFKFQMTRVYLDRKTKHPLRVEQYGWPQRAGQNPPLIELYMYSNIKTNVGLDNRDFDHRNPNYRF